MDTFNIGNIKIGIHCPPLVIPEIGINHNGSLSVAKQIVDSAARAGAKIIKHQTHVIDDEMSAAAKKVIPGNADISIYEIMRSCAFTENEEEELMRYTQDLGLVFLSTPFSRAAADRLQKMGVAAFKIGSGEMNNYPLIEHIASFQKPMIVSTGMNNLDSIHKTVDILQKHNVPFALLHTTNLYPTPPHLIRLGAMQQIMQEFPDTPVGLSDHTLSNNSCIAAMALGACIVERHYTDRMDREGPDIVCSMNEIALKELLRASIEIPQMLGGIKEAALEEKVTIDFAFATVVAIQDIRAGDVFSKSNIWVKRPGTGSIPAERYSSLLGRRAKTNIRKDTHLDDSMIEPE